MWQRSAWCAARFALSRAVPLGVIGNTRHQLAQLIALVVHLCARYLRHTEQQQTVKQPSNQQRCHSAWRLIPESRAPRPGAKTALHPRLRSARKASLLLSQASMWLLTSLSICSYAITVCARSAQIRISVWRYSATIASTLPPNSQAKTSAIGPQLLTTLGNSVIS